MNEKIVVKDEDDDILSFCVVTASFVPGKTYLFVESSDNDAVGAIYVTPEMLELFAADVLRVADLLRTKADDPADEPVLHYYAYVEGG